MRDFFNSMLWNTFVLILLGIYAVFTKEFVTFAMLGFVLIMLSNINDTLKDISRKLDNV
jgi:hypothetical protein